MRQSHCPHVVHVDTFLDLQALKFWEKSILVFFSYQHLLTTSVDNEALEVFLHGLNGTLLNFTDSVLEFSSYVVFFTDFDLKLQHLFILRTTHSCYFWKVFANIFT